MRRVAEGTRFDGSHVMSESVDTLFVYGTLMSTATSKMGRTQRERLAREGRRLGPATMPGVLVDLGRYPGLIAPTSNTQVVHGEAWAIADAAGSLRWLDAYEGIVPGQHPHNEYERRVVRAQLADGTSIEVQVYV